MTIPYTKFKGITSISNTLLMEEIEHNLRMYLDWCFLDIGAWSDVLKPTVPIHGGNFDILYPVIHPNYPNYQVYETPKKNLVYESSVVHNAQSPITIAGVYVNNVLYTSTDATYGHNIDYKNGYVIFNSPLVSTDVVNMEYSFKTVSVEIAEESPLWKEIQFGSSRVDDTHLSDKDKGQWAAIPALKRQQLPAVIVEAVPRRTMSGWQLGSQTLNVQQDVLFHIVAEERYMRNRLIDIISLEQDHVIWLINTDDLSGSTDWPLDYQGYYNSSGLMYPGLVDKYKWLRASFVRVVVSEVQGLNPYLYEGTIRATLEVIFTKD